MGVKRQTGRLVGERSERRTTRARGATRKGIGRSEGRPGGVVGKEGNTIRSATE